VEEEIEELITKINVMGRAKPAIEKAFIRKEIGATAYAIQEGIKKSRKIFKGTSSGLKKHNNV